MIITDYNDGRRWTVCAIDSDTFRVTYAERVAGNWRDIGPADLYSRDCLDDLLECVGSECEINGGV